MKIQTPAPADLFQVEDRLSDEERLVRRAVSRFVDERFLPVVQRHFRAGTFPLELVPEMGALGIFGMTLQGYGCAGASAIAYGAAMQELERGDSALRSCASVQGALCMYPIHAYGSEAQRARFLPAMARGEIVGCFGLTEPDFGSDPGGLRTRAVRDGDAYVLDGAKAWITNGSLADVALVWAKVDGDDARAIRGFLVETGTPGFTARNVEGKLSLRASITSELHLDGVRVPAENVLPGTEGLGLRAPLSCLSKARYGIAWGAVGAAIACFESARAYARERIQFGRPIASFQLVQEKLVDVWEGIMKGQLLALRLGELEDQGGATAAQISMAKRANVRMARDAARTCREILGAAGIVDDHPPMRHMANLESVYTYEGTHDVHTLALGRAATGIDAFT
ncbi:acyl-CoA dehydrogenase family protein [Anaeromyxobacter sp. SG26]|uniref:acyl-CoA dehydrogenase family protein n=1 Tax=Anaeromyxobacter sp. SG26 TaxID=2925407 RepID=UPI001F595014|nr:acyl-CoA dehydrogenase family protein [Anaeromyxobacter sp. SG26]